MSPQMNGEPREPIAADRSTSASTSAQKPSETSVPGDQPLLEPVNTAGVTQTSVTKEDLQLAPLFTQTAAADFHSRWDLVQRSFVDNPREAVHAADELVVQVTQSLAENFAKQRSELEQGLDHSESPTTENLRIALRQYRSFFERLLSI